MYLKALIFYSQRGCVQANKLYISLIYMDEVLRKTGVYIQKLNDEGIQGAIL